MTGKPTRVGLSGVENPSADRSDQSRAGSRRHHHGHRTASPSPSALPALGLASLGPRACPSDSHWATASQGPAGLRALPQPGHGPQGRVRAEAHTGVTGPPPDPERGSAPAELCEGRWEGAASRRNPGPGPDAPRPCPRASRSRPKPRGAWSRPGEGALLPAACDSGLSGTTGSGAEVGELLVCSGGRVLGSQGRLCRDGSTLPSKHEDGQRH